MRNPFRRIKWWFERANGKVPACDCWNYGDTLVNHLEQGLGYLLDEGTTDWDSPFHEKEKKQIEFIRQWAKEYPKWRTAIPVRDLKEKTELKEQFPEAFIVTGEELKEWDARTQKAFAYLATIIYTLWD